MHKESSPMTTKWDPGTFNGGFRNFLTPFFIGEQPHPGASYDNDNDNDNNNN